MSQDAGYLARLASLPWPDFLAALKRMASGTYRPGTALEPPGKAPRPDNVIELKERRTRVSVLRDF